MMRWCVGIFAGVAMAGCSPLEGLVGGEDPNAFASIDTNGDDGISAKEFQTWGEAEGLLSMLGGSDDGIATLDLADGVYPLWDIEGSGITEAEFNQGLATWFPDADAGDFAEWDLDGDASLDRDELAAGFAHTGLSSAWDADGDGILSPREVDGELYDLFDTNGDARLDKREWSGLAGQLQL